MEAVGELIDWEWVDEVLSRFGFRDRFRGEVFDYSHLLKRSYTS